MPEAYGQTEARRMSKSIADDPKALDWSEHIRRVAQDSALKQPQRPSYPSLAGTVRIIGDK